MPKYIDFHARMPQMPADQMQQMKQSVGKRDASGVTPLNAIFTKDGQAYCITDAPNADAVCKYHEAHGMNLGKGDVHEVSNTMGERV